MFRSHFLGKSYALRSSLRRLGPPSASFTASASSGSWLSKGRSPWTVSAISTTYVPLSLWRASSSPMAMGVEPWAQMARSYHYDSAGPMTSSSSTASTPMGRIVDMATDSYMDYNRFLDEQNLEQSEREYQQRSETFGERFLTPRNARWSLFLAETFLKQREYAKAFGYARDCIVMNLGHDSKEFKLLRDTNWFRDSPDPYMEVAHVLAKSIPLSATVGQTQSLSQARYLAGRALFFMGRYQEAAQFFNTCLLEKVDSPDAPYQDIMATRRMLSLCYRRSGHIDHATLILEDGIREAGNSPSIQAVYYADIGATCIEGKRFNAAYDAYSKCIQLRQRDNDPIVSLGIAQALEGLSNFKGAQVAFQQALEQCDALHDKKKAELWLSYLKFLKNTKGPEEEIKRAQEEAQKSIARYQTHQASSLPQDVPEEMEFDHVNAPLA